MPVISNLGPELWVNNYNQCSVQWFLDSVPIPFSNKNNITPTQSGIYTVALGDSGCLRTFSMPFNFVFSLKAEAGYAFSICKYGPSNFSKRIGGILVGSSFITAYDGNPPYTYQWSPGASLDDSTIVVPLIVKSTI